MNSLQTLGRDASAVIKGFAWPMLWQSALLIAVLFALDLLLSRKVRPAVRYALWVVLLIKLVLPPSLALPTGPAWWVGPGHEKRTGPQPMTAVLTHGRLSSSPDKNEGGPSVEGHPKPSFSAEGWGLLCWATVSLGLFAWMAVRWGQVSHAARHAAPATAELEQLLEQTRNSLRLSLRVDLKLVEGECSPAVFGLFKPVILLPRSLANQLSVEQLRGVLLHELIHLRRGDIWTNWAQAILQALYWWHPLLWFANARIRRVREQAVDDAVFCALREDGESYPQTLVEVAKLTLRRSVSSLGLVGIFESQSELSYRIERLLRLSSAPKAGLSLTSMLCILAFSAVALPMGQAPIRLADSRVSERSEHDAWPDPRFQGYAQVVLKAQFLIVDTVNLEQSFPAGVSGPVPLVVASNEVTELDRKLSQAGAERFPHGELLSFGQFSGGHFHYRLATSMTNLVNYQTLLRGDGTSVVIGAECEYGVTTRPDWAPMDFVFVPWTREGLVHCQVRLGPGENTEAGGKEAEVEVPKGGAMLWAMPTAGTSSKSQLVLLKEGEPQPEQNYGSEAKAAGEPQNRPNAMPLVADGSLALKGSEKAQTNSFPSMTGRRSRPVKLEQIRLERVAFDHLSLAEVVRVINTELDKRDFGSGRVHLILSPGGSNASTASIPAEEAELASFRITILPALVDVRLSDVLDTIVRVSNPPIQYSLQNDNFVISRAVDTNKELYTRAVKVESAVFFARLSAARGGANLSTPEAKVQALRDFFLGHGIDLARPRILEFDNGALFVRATLQELDTIDRLVAELDAPAVQLHLKTRFLQVPAVFTASLWRNLGLVDVEKPNLTKILAPPQTAVLLKAVEAEKGADVLSAASVTTLSGRQARVECIDQGTIVTNLANPMVHFVPAVELLPAASNDGWAIDLLTTASLTEFLGYEEPPEANRKGKEPAPVRPRIRVRQITAQTSVPDGFSVLLGNPVDTAEVTRKPVESESRLLVLITATMLDPAGNRIHSDAEVRAARP